MSLRLFYNVIHARGFPRVSGDEPGIVYANSDVELFSPRERG